MKILQPRYRIFKKLFAVFLISTLLFLPVNSAYATTSLEDVCSGLGNDGQHSDALLGAAGLFAITDHISIIQIVCPISRVLSYAMYASGVIFVIMIAYAAIKMSMALGDPKGFDAAKKTLIYAVAGFLIVLLSMNIFGILGSLLGVTIDSSNPFGEIYDNLNAFFSSLGVTTEP